MCVTTRNLFCTAPFNRRRWRNKWQPPVKSSAWFFEFELNPKCRVEKGKADLHSNVLKGAPHPPSLLIHAAFPASRLCSSKFWPATCMQFTPNKKNYYGMEVAKCCYTFILVLSAFIDD
ncbi:hypothetical protein ACFXTH_016582 [Malus domestica]